MSVLISGGTIVNADRTFMADVICDDGRITAVGDKLEAPDGATVIDGGGVGHVITSTGNDHIVVDGFEVRNSGASSYGFYVRNSGISIVNCFIQHQYSVRSAG